MTMLVEQIAGVVTYKAIAGFVAGKAFDVLVSLATDQVQMKLHPPDIKRAIRTGLEHVGAWQESLPPEERLLKGCDDKQKRDFLAQVFVDAGVVGQLQRSLTDNGEPDVELMQGYFERIADRTETRLTVDKLKSWLKQFCQTYVEQTELFIKYQVAKQRYLQQLANWYDDVKFLGISVASQEDARSEKLLQIFVMPDVKERPEEFSQFMEESSGDRDFHNSRQSALLVEQRELAKLIKQEGKTFSAAELLKQSRSRRCVLLGTPGSGKTTLMSYFAVALATGEGVEGVGVDENYLPILVRIRDWIKSDNNGLLNYIRAFATEKLSVRDLPEGFFEHWLENGKALILLDGLDEVAKESRRNEVATQIKVFLKSPSYCDNPAIITSRRAGYKQTYFRSEEFAHYDLMSFDQPKIDDFIRNWYDSRFRDRETSQRRQQMLKQALSGRDRIHILAKNPLLLTIIALIHGYGGYLSQSRHELYNDAVKTLLTTWDAGKDIDYQWPLDHLKRDGVLRIMQLLAYWIHSEGSNGDDEGGTFIDQDKLIEQLGSFIANETDCRRYEAEADAERFLEFIRSRTGLLNEQGQECYAFVHKTFQEYLTAENIRYRQLEYGFQEVLEHIDEHLHDPHWEEVLLLLIAQQPKKLVAQIMQRILNHDTPYEQWLHRNIFFAADCLAENVKLKNEPLLEQIISQLVEFITSSSPLISSQLRRRAGKCLRSLGGTVYQATALRQLERYREQLDETWFQEYRFALGERDSAITELLKQINNSEFSYRRQNPAAALGRLGQGGSTVVNALLKCLNSFDDETSSIALRALDKVIDQGDEEVVQALINLLQNTYNSDFYSNGTDLLRKAVNGDNVIVQTLLNHLRDDDGNVCPGIVYALGDFGQGYKAVVQTLLNCLQEDNGFVQLEALAALGKVGQGNDEVMHVLLNSLQDNNHNVRHFAVTALEKLAQKGDEEVVQALINCLQACFTRSYYKESRSMILWALEKVIDQGNEAVVQALINLLQNTCDSDLYSNVTDFLRKAVNEDILLIQTLLNYLRDDDGNVCPGIVYALGDFGQGDEAVVQTLLNCLQEDNGFVQLEALAALGKVGQGNDEVMHVLLNCLQNNDSHNVRLGAAEGIGYLNQGDKRVLKALINSLQDNDHNIRHFAVTALGKLAQEGDKEVVQALINCLQGNDDIYVITALEKVGQGDKRVMQALINCIENSADVYVRLRAAEALEELGLRDEEAVQPLLSCLQDFNKDVYEVKDIRFRLRVAKTLVKMGQGDKAIVQVLLACLRDFDKDVYVSAAEALEELGLRDETIVRDLLELLRYDDYSIFSYAPKTLVKLEQKATGTVTPFLVEWIEQNQQPEPKDVYDAIDVLWSIVTEKA